MTPTRARSRLLPARLVQALCLIALAFPALSRADVTGEIFNFTHNQQPAYLHLRVLDDQGIHAEYGLGTGPASDGAIYHSPMVLKADGDYPGPGSYERGGNRITTPGMRLDVDAASGCVDVATPAGEAITTICPWGLDFDSGRGLSLSRTHIENAYGVAQWFNKQRIGQSDGDWLTQGWFSTDNGIGNAFSGFPGDHPDAWGANSQVQFPVLQAIAEPASFSFFFDNVYKQDWRFGDDWIEVRNTPRDDNGPVPVSDPAVRFYLFVDERLLDVRQHYMDLVGTPPVPPRKAFGLWLSEFGFDNWGEIDWKLYGDTNRPGLRNAGFPVDGVVLDLQWYGSVERNSPDTRMGSLEWDPGRFPDPDQNIARLGDDHIGLVTIEQSYVGKNRWAYDQLSHRGAANDTNGAGWLIHYCNSNTPIEFSDWFGQVGMIDWSEPGAGAWFHQFKRKPNLIDKGILGHWTDLGEPERYYTNACYDNAEASRFRHTDIHNLYNFLWHRSIYDGYVADGVDRRPFLLARAGAPGIQRFGAAMWSGDITSRLDALANHWNAQMQMSMAGIDYYGSDIGGFWRLSVWTDTAVDPGRLPSTDDLYTQWYAASAWTDVPLRPHTYNCGFDPRFLDYPGCPAEGAQAYETSPAWIGTPDHVESHRFATQQRYALMPYYYSLAHEAFDNGLPVVAPPVIWFEDDPNLREMGHQKMVGKDLLVALVAHHGQYLRNVYLPAGRWADYHTGAWTESSGQWTPEINIWATGKLILPVFVREGTILPMMAVDDATEDAFGHRADGTLNTDLILRIYPAAAGAGPSSFRLWEDDGTTVADYDARTKRPSYARRSTLISQSVNAAGNRLAVEIAAAEGDLSVGPASRNNDIHVFTDALSATAVSLDGSPLAEAASPVAMDSQPSGWADLGNGEIRIKTGERSVASATQVVIDLDQQQTCEPNCPSDIQRTIIFMHRETIPGEDLYLRGGLDHDQAAARGVPCTPENKACAIPITHRAFTGDPNRQSDRFLDWYGAEPGQPSAAGSPLVWTTNAWPAEWGAKRTVEADGYGETPLNHWGPHYWMLDVDMDCARTVDGWFELKSFVVTNGAERWEDNVDQDSAGQPYRSNNHFGRCGKVNVFDFGQSTAIVEDLP